MFVLLKCVYKMSWLSARTCRNSGAINMAKVSNSFFIIAVAVAALIFSAMLGMTFGDDQEPIPAAIRALQKFKRPVILPIRGSIKISHLGSTNGRRPSKASVLSILT